MAMEISVPAHAARALEALEAAGWESWAVGGCVRDALLGLSPHDWDLCTAAAPEQVLACFAGKRLLETGRKHGTVTLLTPDGPLEITTFRRDGAYTDRRHPDGVEFVARLEEDLARRDFTVNAMAYHPRRGLRDPFGGREDLDAGILRCVGDAAARFREDPLRILRGLRFAARLGFRLEASTAAAARRDRALLATVSAERVLEELLGILCAPGAGRVLLEYPEILFAVLPELAPMEGFQQHRPEYHCWDVWGHTARAVEAAVPEPAVRLAMLFHDSGKPATFSLDPETGRGRFYGHPAEGARIAEAALTRLRCAGALRRDVVCLVENHEMRTGHTRRALRRLLARMGEENLLRLLDVRRADAAAHAPAARERLLALAAEDAAAVAALLSEPRCLSVKDLAVGGGDLLALGMAPGPALGRVLASLLEKVLDEELPNQRPALLEAAREAVSNEKGGMLK